MVAIKGGFAVFVPAMAAAAFAPLELLSQFCNFFQLVSAAAGSRSLMRASPPLIDPGPRGLGGLVPHLEGVVGGAPVPLPGP